MNFNISLVHNRVFLCNKYIRGLCIGIFIKSNFCTINPIVDLSTSVTWGCINGKFTGDEGWRCNKNGGEKLRHIKSGMLASAYVT